MPILDVLAQVSDFSERMSHIASTSVLRVPGTQRQQKIMVMVTQFFRDHGRQVITMPLEKISGAMKKTPRPKAENLTLAF